MEDFRMLADAVSADIGSGRLKPGARLPPQREFAYQRGIAVSTASRVYSELARRGLVAGEVGRGTFVRLGEPLAVALAEPPLVPVDLEFNFPILPGQPAAVADTLRQMVRPEMLVEALRPVRAAATPEARARAALFLRAPLFKPDPQQLLFTGNGRQAIAAAFSALAAPGDRIGVEPLTFAFIKGMASRLGITLVPLAMDEEGVLPESIIGVHRSTPLKAIYLQPALHNPLGCTMGENRRKAVALALQETNLIAIEDGIYSFLGEEAPLIAYAPEQVVLVESLSKRGAPGLTLGFIVCPPALVDRLAEAVRSGAWIATGFALAYGLAWMGSEAAALMLKTKREDASARQRLAREILRDLHIAGDARAYHLWLELPPVWRAEAFAATAARKGIAVTPGNAFAVTPGHAPNAVRLALASPPLDVLASALEALKSLCLSGPITDLD